MHFSFARRPAGLATTIRACTLCGAQVQAPPTGNQTVESLCATCARPVRLRSPRTETTTAQTVEVQRASR